MLQTAEASCSHPAVRRRAQDRPTWRRLARVLKLGPHVHLPGHSSASQAPVGLTRMNKLAREELRRLSRPPSIEEEKLKFYIASCSFGLRLLLAKSASRRLRNRGLKYREPELTSLTLVLLLAIARPLQTRKPASPCLSV